MHQAGLIGVSPIPKFTKTKRRKRKHETPGNVAAVVFFSEEVLIIVVKMGVKAFVVRYFITISM